MSTTTWRNRLAYENVLFSKEVMSLIGTLSWYHSYFSYVLNHFFHLSSPGTWGKTRASTVFPVIHSAQLRSDYYRRTHENCFCPHVASPFWYALLNVATGLRTQWQRQQHTYVDNMNVANVFMIFNATRNKSKTVLQPNWLSDAGNDVTRTREERLLDNSEVPHTLQVLDKNRMMCNLYEGMYGRPREIKPHDFFPLTYSCHVVAWNHRL
jgi:hypothetical protein